MSDDLHGQTQTLLEQLSKIEASLRKGKSNDYVETFSASLWKDADKLSRRAPVSPLSVLSCRISRGRSKLASVEDEAQFQTKFNTQVAAALLKTTSKSTCRADVFAPNPSTVQEQSSQIKAQIKHTFKIYEKALARVPIKQLDLGAMHDAWQDDHQKMQDVIDQGYEVVKGRVDDCLTGSTTQKEVRKEGHISAVLGLESVREEAGRPVLSMQQIVSNAERGVKKFTTGWADDMHDGSESDE